MYSLYIFNKKTDANRAQNCTSIPYYAVLQ